ncbi:hypothetical protein USB125703_00923 [Pseudoclavibacter triregionum]|nr:hypothetical protein USB125703_00923 [Pseudoclavibacter triregionum]
MLRAPGAPSRRPLGDDVFTLTDPKTDEMVDLTSAIVGADGEATAAPASGAPGGTRQGGPQP